MQQPNQHFHTEALSNCRRNRSGNPWGASRIVFFLLCLLTSPGIAPGAEPLSDHAITLNLLESRRKQQVAATQSAQTFHGFRFTDRIKESQITFTHGVCADCLEDQKSGRKQLSRR